MNSLRRLTMWIAAVSAAGVLAAGCSLTVHRDRDRVGEQGEILDGEVVDGPAEGSDDDGSPSDDPPLNDPPADDPPADDPPADDPPVDDPPADDPPADDPPADDPPADDPPVDDPPIDEPPGDEPPIPVPEDGGASFEAGAATACGHTIEATVEQGAPVWFRMNTAGQIVHLVLDVEAGSAADLDLHATDGPTIPDDQLAVSESPTGHEELTVTDVGPVGIRVLLWGGAESSAFTLAISCEPVTDAPPTDPPPVGELDCIDYQPLHAQGMQGTALTDIVQHLPQGQINIYCDPDRVTCAHEVSHGVHAHLRNNYNPTGQTANAFYILDDRACFVVEPGILKSAVGPHVPPSLRGSRYGTYVTGQTAWNDRPLYIWDEWNAYVNGGEAAISLYDEGLWGSAWRDQSGVVEFVSYGIATAMAAEAGDPDYFSSERGPQLLAMLRYLVTRSLDLHRTFSGLSEFQSASADDVYHELRSGAGGAPLRAFLVEKFGQPFVDDVLAL